MERWILSQSQWERIAPFLLPGKKGDCGVTAQNNRLFVEAVLWIARTGSPWRDLPRSFGHWHRVYVRYNRWSHKKIWERVFKAMSEGSDLNELRKKGVFVSGSGVRSNQVAFRKKLYADLEALQKNLDDWIKSYNNDRTHQGKMCCGRTPMETLFDGKRIWVEKNLTQI